MVELHGRTLTRREVAEHTGMLAQVAGVRLVTLGDGIERGVRVLEFRTGGGLRFTVMVDRGFDVAECDYKGQAIGWHSPAGFRNPALHEYEGEGGLAFVRSFSGLLATCGLDHTMGPAEVPADSYNYPGRKTVRHSLHGRVSLIPARLAGYGERWEGDRCFLWAEGVVQQSAMFGEDLYLFRRIEAEVGSKAIRVSDRVENHGFYRTPHMFFYHVNVGWPLLEAGVRYLAPIREVLWAAHAESYAAQGVGYRTVAAPREGFCEQVWEHDLAADAGGECPAALVNDRLGLGFEVVTRKDELPCFYQWQNYQAGHYALGIEPSTHHILGEVAARERGEMIWLEHGESRPYTMTMRVLDGADEIAAAERRIAGIARQPAEDFPAPSGRFAALWRSGEMSERRAMPKRDYSLTGPSAAWAVETGLASAEWYHSDVPRKVMKELMQRSDQPAIRDTAVWLGVLLLMAAGGVAFWGTWWCVPFFALYGVFYASASDSRWHECGHGTAFRTRWMNDWVYQIASFMQVRNPVTWRWSHARHHTDTIIVGRDAEIAVMRPPDLLRAGLSFFGLLDFRYGYPALVRNALGRLSADEKDFIPEPEWPKAVAAARWHVAIYLATIALALGLRSWLPLMLIGLPRIYGTWHMVLTGLLQHIGLADNVVDHRLNSRTVLMNPFSRFVYWNMNYHVEHHMFPMVPYHALPRLHAVIKDDLPAPSPSMWHAYREVWPVVLRQLAYEDEYLRRELPPSARPYRGELHGMAAE